MRRDILVETIPKKSRWRIKIFNFGSIQNQNVLLRDFKESFPSRKPKTFSLFFARSLKEAQHHFFKKNDFLTSEVTRLLRDAYIIVNR